jgi:beta-galactosidase/beta-glucuronidase
VIPESSSTGIDRRAFLVTSGVALSTLGTASADELTLPTGVKAVWDLEKAHREKILNRERFCLNGLWRWQPAKEQKDNTDAVPSGGWGYFKVPGFWPGNTSYIQEDCQTLHVHPSWRDANLRTLTAAWYQREITVPETWKSRRIALTADYVNSFAVVYLDGKKVGELRYPGGEFDLTSACVPGKTYTLSLLVVAMPLKGVMLSHTDTNAAKEVKGTVDRRGLCGDVWLASTPVTRITDVRMDTSLSKRELTFDIGLDGLVADGNYKIHIQLLQNKLEPVSFPGKEFRAGEVKHGRISVTHNYKPEKLWDTHTPQNICIVRVALADAKAHEVLDAFYPVRSGLRELRIDGRDFYLNGTRIHLSAVPLDNAQISARTASYDGTVETFKRLQSFGINFVYTHNYGCEPGSHVSFEEVLSAADDVGMLVAFSQPHFSHYDWKAADADKNNGYAKHAEFYVRAVQNHPCVVAYSMSHNATGYDQDMNPDMIDGLKDPRVGDNWSTNNAALALRAEAIVKKLDPTRIVYHHSSGNLGSMHTVNFYLNFVPIQEMSDWFEHWATKGVKPLFLCEYGVPFTWDWTMYRGWYKGERTFGSAKVPWEFCAAEWNAQFLGDTAYRVTDMEKRNLRWEAEQFAKGNLWHRWDYPTSVGSPEFNDRQEVFARYITDNWRAHRTWGLSANSPWEYGAFWRLRPGVDRKRAELKTDYETLQKPGFSPDYVAFRHGWMSVDGERTDWIATPAAEALIRNNQPILTYIAGKPSSFTSKDHNFLAGEAVEKQLIVINDSREPVTCKCSWSLPVAKLAGNKTVTVLAGQQERIPIRAELPDQLVAGNYELSASAEFGNGKSQNGAFRINVLSPLSRPSTKAKIALFDPKGETGKLLTRQGVGFESVKADADLAVFDLLVVGKEALSADGPAPDVKRVRDGLKVIVFEQTGKALETRFGFRVAEYGLREVFPRVPDHPLLNTLRPEHLRDWRGEAALLEPRLKYTTRPRYGPTVKWCGIDVSHVWRCGNRGNVASVLIEKPARGDFLPVLDGGYALQYSPLMEYREGKGMALFCQMDITARSENDPAAETLASNIVRYVSDWKPMPRRTAMYVGDPAGKKHLEVSGLSLLDYSKDKLNNDHVLIVGPGGAKELTSDALVVGEWVSDKGGHVLALGLTQAETRSFLPIAVETKMDEHISTYFEPPLRDSLLAGISPANVHNRDPRTVALISGGVTVIGNGVLATAKSASVVFCQLLPWQFDWKKTMNLKRTFRHVSYLVTRLAANMGAAASTPILTRFASAAKAGDQRWLDGLYLDVPEEWDDPYRFFRW